VVVVVAAAVVAKKKYEKILSKILSSISMLLTCWNR
jgi:hypothetical protein